MVCLSNNSTGSYPVLLKSESLEKKVESTLLLSSNKNVRTLYSDISLECGYRPEQIELIIENGTTGYKVNSCLYIFKLFALPLF